MDNDITRMLNLSEAELKHFDESEVSEEIAELREEFEKFHSMNSRRLKLQSDYARLNYEIYETFMSTHQNAIAMSGMFSELRIAGRKPDKETIEEIEAILNGYLMFEGFE